MQPSGQGSLEYVGVLAVVAAALVAAGPVAGASGVGGEVARVVRTGLCIVGGDVCRASDARAAGLEPCTLSDRRRGDDLAVTIMSIQVSAEEQMTIARRSDGSFLVVRSKDAGAGVDVGLGLDAGTVRLGVDGTAEVKVAKATAWELPDETALRHFLAGEEGAGPGGTPPLWQSGDVGLATSGLAGLGAKTFGGDAVGTPVVGIEVAARTAAGVRIGRGTTTYYLRGETTGPQIADAYGHVIAGRSGGPVVVEYTRDDDGPRELAFRVTAAGARGEVVDTVARMDLRDPGSREVAGRLLRLRPPWAGEAADELRAAIRRAAAVGTIERSVYAVEDASRGVSLAGRLGIAFGGSYGKTDVARRLVAASAWTPGSEERIREDCLARDLAPPA